jgi:PncC family amidohydrolase
LGVDVEIPTELLISLEKIHTALAAKGRALATAESCTAGLLSFLLTERPGSSRFFRGGVSAYANDLKEKLLGVSHDQLAKYGAVSSEVAIAMAIGAKKLLGADYGVSLTGIAGPEGGSPEKPVGTIWCGVSGVRGSRARLFQLQGTRSEIRLESAKLALIELLTEINK